MEKVWSWAYARPLTALIAVAALAVVVYLAGSAGLAAFENPPPPHAF